MQRLIVRRQREQLAGKEVEDLRGGVDVVEPGFEVGWVGENGIVVSMRRDVGCVVSVPAW
jgi:hypothetical protein